MNALRAQLKKSGFASAFMLPGQGLAVNLDAAGAVYVDFFWKKIQC